jgi:hypothetical protein
VDHPQQDQVVAEMEDQVLRTILRHLQYIMLAEEQAFHAVAEEQVVAEMLIQQDQAVPRLFIKMEPLIQVVAHLRRRLAEELVDQE